MSLSLEGRLLTRVLLLFIVGLPWIGAITPLLNRPPFVPQAAPLSTTYYTNYLVLAVVLCASLVWELAYHIYTQTRWDRDWPSLLALLVGVGEGWVGWLLCADLLGLPISAAPYAAMFGGLWLLMWAIVQGPLRVVSPRWRFGGGVL